MKTCVECGEPISKRRHGAETAHKDCRRAAVEALARRRIKARMYVFNGLVPPCVAPHCQHPVPQLATGGVSYYCSLACRRAVDALMCRARYHGVAVSLHEVDQQAPKKPASHRPSRDGDTLVYRPERTHEIEANLAAAERYVRGLRLRITEEDAWARR